MKNKIIIYIATFFIITGAVFAQNSAGRFSLKDIDSYWQSSITTEHYESSYIPKNRPFGTSFYWGDSTGYIVFSKGIYMQDSLKVAKDLYIGVKGGKVYLDTARTGQIYFTGLSMYLSNTKTNGYMYFSSHKAFNFEQDVSGSLIDISTLDTNGYEQKKGNIWLTGGTQQIKLPSDTASDYDGNDAITLNRQSGTVTTKSLTTASDGFYTMTLTNSLITTTSKVFLSYCGGTESAGRPTVYRVVSNSGSATIILLNLTGAGSFNGDVKLNFVVFN